MARTQIATDDFNRASLGTSDWAQMNTGLAGDVQTDSSIRIKGQYGTQPTDQKPTARWIGAGTFSNDQYSSLRLTAGPAGGSQAAVGVAVRASGSAGTRTFYEFFVDGLASNYNTTLSKWVNGTRTVLHTSTGVSWASNDLISIEVEGTQVRGCKNGTPLGGSFTLTDASISSGAPGVVAASNGFNGDDWEGGDVTAPASAMSGDGVLSNLEASGTMSEAGASEIGGDGALSVMSAGGGVIGAIGTIVSPVLKNNAGTVLANVTNIVANIYHQTTGALILRKTGLASDADGIVTISDTAIATGTTYAYELDLTAASLGRRLPTKVAT